MPKKSTINFEWSPRTVREFNKVMNRTVELGGDSKKAAIIAGHHFSKVASSRTQQGKKNVYRQIKMESGGSVWIAPTDGMQKSWDIVKFKKDARFTPRGRRWHKLAWLVAASRLPWTMSNSGKPKRTGTKGVQRWARGIQDVSEDMRKFYSVITVRHFGPAIEAMQSGGRGLVAKDIMGYALYRTARQQDRYNARMAARLKRIWGK